MVSYDNKRSVELKTAYAKRLKLNGIMFWQLGEDSYKDGLLDAIDQNPPAGLIIYLPFMILSPVLF